MRLTATTAFAITGFAMAFALASGAQAAGNLVQNGSFTANTVSGASLSGIEVDGAFGNPGAVTGWTSAGGSTYNLYFFGNGKETVGGGGIDAASRWGEGGQRPNINFTGDSPDGGAYMVLDGDPGFSGGFSQDVTGLTAGQRYNLSFYWAAGELFNRTGYSNEKLQVTFAGVTYSTPTFTNAFPGCNGCTPPGSFSGWSLVNFQVIADNTHDVLSFLSVGTPAANLPPVAFLDGVSLVRVPEPADWILMLAGFFGLGAAVRRRRVVQA